VYEKAPDATPHEITFRHACWADQRRRVRQALTAAGTGRSSLDAFDHCGSDASVYYCKEESTFKVAANYCHNRHCQPCMRAKGLLLAKNLQKIVQDKPGKQYRFITLTLRHTTDPLETQLDRLNTCFKKLRNSVCWKSSQDGGAAMVECKYNRETGEWHPHLHIVAEGRWLAQADLATRWLEITGDSFKVDIRVIKSARDAAYYVAKYVSKGTNDDVWTSEHTAVEWIQAMRGRRTCATYGTWRGQKLLEHEADTRHWTYVDRLDIIARAAARNEAWAVGMYDALRATLQYDPHRKRTPKGDTQPAVVT
jgi:hypothetical protein